jgi:hypothetical protein
MIQCSHNESNKPKQKEECKNMALGNIYINGKQITEKEFFDEVKRKQLERITHIVESHNSMEWVTDGEFYFEDLEVAEDYYKLTRSGMIDELTPINPDEILLYVYNEKSIITIDTIDELFNARHNDDDESYGWTQYDEDNAIYLEIVREGLGL